MSERPAPYPSDAQLEQSIDQGKALGGVQPDYITVEIHTAEGTKGSVQRFMARVDHPDEVAEMKRQVILALGGGSEDETSVG